MRDELLHCAVGFLTALWSTCASLQPLAGKPWPVCVHTGSFHVWTVEHEPFSMYVSILSGVKLFCWTTIHIPKSLLFLVKYMIYKRRTPLCADRGVILSTRNFNQTPVKLQKIHSRGHHHPSITIAIDISRIVHKHLKAWTKRRHIWLINVVM